METGENPCVIWLFSTFLTDFLQKKEKEPVENSEKEVPKKEKESSFSPAVILEKG